MDIGMIAIIIFGVVILYLTLAPEWVTGTAESAGGLVWGFLEKLFSFFMILLLGIFVVPAMLIMAWFYPIWHEWIKGHGDWKENILMVIGIIPLSILVLYAMIVMALLHTAFNDRVKAVFGLKPF